MTLQSTRRIAVHSTSAPIAVSSKNLAILRRVAAHIMGGRQQAAAHELHFLPTAEVCDPAQCRLFGSILCGVDAMPEAFKIVEHELGEVFFCEACDRPAATSYPPSK